MDALVAEGYSEEYGARPLKRVLEQKIEDKLAEELLEGTIGEGDVVIVDYVNNAYCFRKKK